MLRALAFNIILVATGFLLSLWCFIAFRHRYADGVLNIAKLWARISLRALRLLCGINVEVQGLEHLRPGIIVAAQHQSELDVLIWIVHAPRPAFVFKRELRKLPVFGALLEPGGMIPVDRGGGTAALQSMVTGCAAALAKGHQVVIFPEGTRTAPGTRAKLRNGVFALANATKAPVLPAVTDTGRFWPKNPFQKHPGTAHLKIFTPLPELPRDELMSILAQLFYQSP